MEYYEKRSLLSLPLLTAVYASMYYDVHQYLSVPAAESTILNFWGNIFLELFLCLIFVYVIFYFCFNYFYKKKTGEGKPKLIDERDRGIEHRAVHAAYYVLAGGVFTGLLTSIHVRTVSPVFIIIMTAFMASGFSADLVRLASYRKGR